VRPGHTHCGTAKLKHARQHLTHDPGQPECATQHYHAWTAGERAAESSYQSAAHPLTPAGQLPGAYLEGAVEPVTSEGRVGEELPRVVEQHVEGQAQAPELRHEAADRPAEHRELLIGQEDAAPLGDHTRWC
jgi:hypothetical protein